MSPFLAQGGNASPWNSWTMKL